MRTRSRKSKTPEKIEVVKKARGKNKNVQPAESDQVEIEEDDLNQGEETENQCEEESTVESDSNSLNEEVDGLEKVKASQSDSQNIEEVPGEYVDNENSSADENEEKMDSSNDENEDSGGNEIEENKEIENESDDDLSENSDNASEDSLEKGDDLDGPSEKAEASDDSSKQAEASNDENDDDDEEVEDSDSSDEEPVNISLGASKQKSQQMQKMQSEALRSLKDKKKQIHVEREQQNKQQKELSKKKISSTNKEEKEEYKVEDSPAKTAIPAKLDANLLEAVDKDVAVDYVKEMLREPTVMKQHITFSDDDTALSDGEEMSEDEDQPQQPKFEAKYIGAVSKKQQSNPARDFLKKHFFDNARITRTKQNSNCQLKKQLKSVLSKKKKIR